MTVVGAIAERSIDTPAPSLPDFGAAPARSLAGFYKFRILLSRRLIYC